MNKKRVLFLCTHNSARSPMAEAWLQRLGDDSFEVESAGLEPGTLKPLVIEAMREVGIDLSRKTTQSILDVLQSGRMFHYVIALYEKAKEAQCPTFPGLAKRLHWTIPERPKLAGTGAAQLAHVRAVRDLIKARVEAWLAENP
jgi:arsenate reductase